MDIWSYLFPKKCISCKKLGAYLCAVCFARLDTTVVQICGVCGRQAVDGLTHPSCQGKTTIDGVFAAYVYNQLAKKLLYQFKFSPYLTHLKSLLGELFFDALSQQELFYQITRDRELLLTYIPLHRKKEQLRGYNQSQLLAEEIAKQLQIPVHQFLVRQLQTISQVGKSQDERRLNVKGAFVLRDGQQGFAGKTIVIVDDVVTSGSTLNEAAKVLKKAGAGKVYGLAFAHGR